MLTKEWYELLKSRILLVTAVLTPLGMLVCSVGMLWAVSQDTEIKEKDHAEIAALVGERAEQLPEAIDVFAVYMGEMALMLLLLLPAIVPSLLAANTIVREKQTRSLESLLVTPVRTWELVAAKVLFCLLVGIIPTYLCVLVFYGAAAAWVSSAALSFLAAPAWLITIVVTGPLIGVFAVGVAIGISARARDVQGAQQLAGMVTLPLVALMTLQAAGIGTLSTTSALLGAALLLVIDVVAIAVSISLFERETVLTRWR